MRSSESIAAIAPALVAALNEIGGVAKGSDNPFFKSKYASLEAVIDASKPILAAHDLAIMQGGGSYQSGALATTTRILHKSGEWIESTMEIPPGLCALLLAFLLGLASASGPPSAGVARSLAGVKTQCSASQTAATGGSRT